MTDILKHIVADEGREWDPEGHLLDYGAWDQERAETAAREEGIELSGEHWEVIQFLRDYYRDHGEPHNATELTRVLTRHFGSSHSRERLYRLFPHGPVVQGCHIAGLPIPAHSRDQSFGSVA